MKTISSMEKELQTMFITRDLLKTEEEESEPQGRRR